MAGRTMGIFAKLHIWLAWLAGVPILMWAITGLVMVAKPIDETRGTDRILSQEKEMLPGGNLAPIVVEGADRPVELRTRMQGNSPVTSAIYADGKVERYWARSGVKVPPLDVDQARTLVAMQVKGGDKAAGVTYFSEKEPPSDFRRAIPVWRVELADGTYVYVGRDSGEIEAVRTRWWRLYDFMWGLHIMDLQTREKIHSPVIVAFASLAIVFSLLGTVLMFRNRRNRAKAPASVGTETATPLP